jgi:HK97 gp10 family phage protein
MPPIIEVKVSGLDKIEDALERAPLRIAKQIMRNALKVAAAIWQREMVARVRRGPHHPPGGGSVDYGVIAENISMSTTVKSDLEGSARVGVPAKLYWAKFLEFGTGPRARRPKNVSKKAWQQQGGGNRMPAFPFVRQSGSSRAQDVLDTFTDAARSEIEQEYGK